MALYIVGIIPFIIPYVYLGENFSNILLATIAASYILFNIKDIKVNKKIFNISAISILVVMLWGGILNPTIEGISGVMLYLNIPLYLIIYFNIDRREKFKEYLVLALGSFALFYIIFQGVFLDYRVYGNVGYANTYALLLLVGFYINKTIEKNKYYNYMELIFIVGILYTGSRSTLVLLFIYVIIELFKDIKKIQNLILGFIIYSILATLGVKALFIMPILLIVYKFLTNLKVRWKNYSLYAILLMGSVALFTTKTNTIERIKNISFTNGSFQERLIYFKDAISAIVENPFGYGCNTYKYNKWVNATAYYDIKYIHNSYLQFLYDFGAIVGLLIIVLIALVGFIIYKSESRNRNIYLTVYLSILFHGLLDFDFSYTVLPIILVLLIALNIKSNEAFNLGYRYLAIILIPILSYLFIVEGSLALSKSLEVNKKVESVITVNKAIEKITKDKDARVTFNLANAYKEKYDNIGNEEFLYMSGKELEKTLILNPMDSRAIWNLNYIYFKTGDLEKLEKIKDILYKSQSLNPNFYKAMEQQQEELHKSIKD